MSKPFLTTFAYSVKQAYSPDASRTFFGAHQVFHTIGGLMAGTLVLHRGAQPCTRDELAEIRTPEPTDTHFPVSHMTILQTAVSRLNEAGFEATREELAIAKDGNRFFAVIDVKSEIVEGEYVSIGLRSSHDRSLALSWAAGARCFVCDNLAFSSQVIIARKHTRYGVHRFGEAIQKAISGLPQFIENERKRLLAFQQTMLPSEAADSIMLRAFELQIINHVQLRKAMTEYREPTVEAFAALPHSLYRMYQAFTTTLAPRRRHPQSFVASILRLQGLLTESAQCYGASVRA